MAPIKMMGIPFIADHFGVNRIVIDRVIKQDKNIQRLCKLIQGTQRFAWPSCEKTFARVLISTCRPEVVDRVKSKVKEYGLDLGSVIGDPVVKNIPVEEQKESKKESKKEKWYDDEEEDDTQYADAAKRRIIYQAAQEKLKYERESGKVIDLSAVMKEWGNIAISVQKAILTIPDRVAPLCVGKEAFEVHTLLMMELKYALKNLAFELKDKSDDNNNEQNEGTGAQAHQDQDQ